MASEQRADIIHRIDHLNSNSVLSDLGNCESNGPWVSSSEKLIEQAVKKQFQLSKFEDLIGFIK